MTDVVSSSPGYAVLVFWPDEGTGEFVSKDPVVAWRIERDVAIPITPDQSDTERRYAIRYPDPDGRVVVPFDRGFESEAAWLAYERERARKAADDAVMAKITGALAPKAYPNPAPRPC
jgi:hypothetical protein